MAGLTGFNPEEVSQSISSVIRAYEELIKALGDDMQTQFVGGMADKWACNQAKNFFNNAFKPAVDSLISNSNKIFESVVNAMNGGAQRWAADTESSYSPKAFNAINKTIDTSSIAENIGGVRGIDLASANSVSAKLPTIAESAKSALTATVQAVQNCGFIGGDQATNLSNSLNTIKNRIDSATREITTESKQAIDKTIEVYGDTEGQVSEAFAANN
ncbi:MAG TPA: hypothetical protein IAB35_03815 [Candidatus Faecimonas gallistercoris]|nr:hypothetical protein [Candidatus Faecimonas gallistercoris]